MTFVAMLDIYGIASRNFILVSLWVIEQFAAGHSYCINTLFFQKSAQDSSIFSFISIIHLISRSVCCMAPL